MGEVIQEAHFKKDTINFLEKLNALFLQFESGHIRPESVEEAFRCFHSIKSEAAYLEHTEISNLAHEGEEILDACRTNAAAVSSRLLDSMFSITSKIEKALNTQGTSSKGSKSLSADGVGMKVAPVPAQISHFTSSEKDLLSEAKNRNEQLYRVVCTFLPDLPMKYPRAFLILNNLEQNATVIRTTPDLYEKNRELDSLTVYFTTSGNGGDIRELFNVDGIGSVYFSQIPWSLIFRYRKETSEKSASFRHRDVMVPVEKLDEVLGTLHCVKMRLFNKSPQGIEDISSIEHEIKQMRMVHLEEEFSRYTVFVRNIVKELGKQAEFSYSGGNLQIDKNIVEKLSDSLMQLVRNALVHGIEKPEKRLDAGKSEKGSIHISAISEGNGLEVTISDDGAGIDEEHIREVARHSGIFGNSPDNMELLDILSAQGFSTAPEISNIAGRGIGLDVVREKIHSIPGARLTMESEQGKGVSFILHVPYAVSLVRMHIFRYESQMFALYESTIQEPQKLEQSKFSTDADKGLLYDSKPVYTVFGRVYLVDSFPSSGLIIPFKRKNEEAVLFTLEDVSIEDLPRELMQTIETTIPGLHDIFLSDRRVPYLLFSP